MAADLWGKVTGEERGFDKIWEAGFAAKRIRCVQTRTRCILTRIRCVQSRPDRAPRLILLEGVKGGGSGLEWLPPLWLYDADGEHSEEWRRIYGEK